MNKYIILSLLLMGCGSNPKETAQDKKVCCDGGMYPETDWLDMVHCVPANSHYSWNNSQIRTVEDIRAACGSQP